MKDTSTSKTNTFNPWDLASLFKGQHSNIKYDSQTKIFYIYIEICKVWKPLNLEALNHLIIRFIKANFPKKYKQFNLSKLPEIVILLKQLFNEESEFSLLQSKIEANQQGTLIPFLNGILNTKTLELLPHKPSYYMTHLIPLDYDTKATIKETPFSTFLIQLCNFDLLRLKILRAGLYLILTNDLTFQKALYIYGIGGSGKSTLVNILTYLLGSEACLSTDLVKLNSRFGLASLYGKLLVVLNDISLFKGREPKVLKEIITGDKMQAEEKYCNPFSFTPTAFVILTSNVIWDVKEATSGLHRRMLYLPFDFTPSIRDRNLFKFTGNLASGTLYPYLAGFINWILNCPLDYIELFNESATATSEKLGPDSIAFNPLHVWVQERLTSDIESKSYIGSNKSGEETLFGNYSK